MKSRLLILRSFTAGRAEPRGWPGAPVPLYHAAIKRQVQTAGAIFKEETYGIAPPIGSPSCKPINEALLKLKQDGTYEEL